MNSATTFLPRWTKRAVLDGSGRDPLGLSRVSDNFTELLLPSIITTTNRARYYSFYPWAMRESVEAVETSDSEVDFVEELRKREAAFAISSKLGKVSDLSIVGIDQVNKKLREAADKDTISTLFRVLPANDYGGFGQYYGGCLWSLGLGGWEEDGMWRVNAKRGRKLADAFGVSVEEASYVKKRCGGMEEISLKVLRESASEFSLDGIRGDAAKDERELLTRMMFDLDEDADTHGSVHRQATLGQLLHVLEAYQGIASPPERKDVADSCMFWPHYYGCLYAADGVSVRYDSHPAFQESGSYWRQFCVHQFFTYATEQFLQAILDSVSKTSEGLTKRELVGTMCATGFVNELEEATQTKLPGPAALMDYFRAGEEPEKVQEMFSANHDLAEWWIYAGDNESAVPSRLGRAFAIWAQLHAKWRKSDDAALWDVAEKAAGEWWAGNCFEWGDEWVKEKPSWPEAVERLTDEVHSRHELVRFQKHKLDAAWMEKTGERYSKIQDLVPDFRANRHNNAATILQDLCLIEEGGLTDPMKLTGWGRKTLKAVINARS